MKRLSGEISEASCVSTVEEMNRSFPETRRRLFQAQITVWPKAEEQGIVQSEAGWSTESPCPQPQAARWSKETWLWSQKGERVENLVHRVSQPNVSAPIDTALRKH